VDAQLIADAVLLADPVQRIQAPGVYAILFVPVVARRPTPHGALLDAEVSPRAFAAFRSGMKSCANCIQIRIPC